jgi:dienelactone hydrolase
MVWKPIPLALAFCVAACATSAPQTLVEPVAVNIPIDDPNTKTLAARLYPPAGKGPFAAVVILSGCVGVRFDAGIVERVNASYLPAGIATLVVDSFTPRGIEEACSDPKLNFESVRFRVKDVYAAVDWLAARSDVDSNRIYLQGYSHGALVAITTMDAQWPRARFPKVAGVVAFYPWCSAATKVTVRTLVLIGESDDWTPVKLCRDIVDKSNLQITTYPLVQHSFAAPDRDMTYLGHRLLYDQAAAEDALRRALQFIQSDK